MPQPVDDRAVLAIVIGCRKDRRAGHKTVGTCKRDFCDVFHFNPTIHLQHDRCTALLLVAINQSPHRFDFLKTRGQKLLPSKSGINRHQQNKVEPMHYMFKPL